MKAFTRILGIAVIGMVVAIALAGCELNPEEDGYTLRFKVDNDTNLRSKPKTIKKVEFINGDRQNDKVVGYLTDPIEPGKRSSEQWLFGFTVEYDSSTRKCGVKVTFEDDTVVFDWDAFGHENKVLVSVDYNSAYYPYQEGYYFISFSPGNW